MRKSLHFFCLTFFMTLIASQSYAQKNRSEIAIGYGYFSAYSFINHSMNDASISTSSGSPAITYRYYISRNVTLGMTVAHESISTWGDFTTIAPEVTVAYLDTRHDYVRVRLYGAASYGVSLMSDNDIPRGSADESGAKPWGLQVTPFGMRVGRQFAGFLEVGMGYKGLLHGGIELRWPQVVAKHRHHHDNDDEDEIEVEVEKEKDEKEK